MVCHNCKMELPVQAKYCPNCGRQAHHTHAPAHLDSPAKAAAAARAQHMARLFEPAFQRIETRLEDARVDRDELFDLARRLEAETVKGGAANVDKMSRWLRQLGELAPDVLAPVMVALNDPAAELPAALQQTLANIAPQPA
jgi:hypothetical protein